ncbi:MAG TPA: aminotransferase class I/II-fold pyridoxal phosphate-dependent enzyme [Gaiellaceae bacterium]|nr:aminotransferase class I/II-fold pyridoxal phosphate-dependent enzyme [Gaiellaceae bacterium]
MTSEVESLLVPAARTLPSARSYLAHLDAAAADPTLVRLASNESGEPPSPRVAEALAAAYADAHRYPPTMPPLLEALAARAGVSTDRVLLGAGSTELIDATFRAFVRRGDEVVLPTPSWPVYRARLDALEASVVEVPLRRGDDAFAYDVDALAAAISPRTKIVVVCTPNNPTGNAVGLDALRALAAASPLLLVDAAYAEFGVTDPATLVHELANVVVTRTFSKAYSLAGLRVGYALGAAEVLDYVGRFLVPGSSAGGAALHAAAAALDDDEHMRAHVARVRADRERLLAELRERGFRALASEANFVAVDPAPLDAVAFAERLRERGVLVRPLGGLVRITVGSTAEVDALLSAL